MLLGLRYTMKREKLSRKSWDFLLRKLNNHPKCSGVNSHYFIMLTDLRVKNSDRTQGKSSLCSMMSRASSGITQVAEEWNHLEAFFHSHI